MVSAAKAFAKEPPRRSLDNLTAIAEDFQWRYVDRKKTDQVIDYCKSAPTLRVAIDRAVRARDAQGKHHNHQSKVNLDARLDLGKELKRLRPNIRRIVASHERKRRFDELYDFIDEIKPYGIGPVTVYDVAVRIGAYLNIEPMSVYLHAGVRQGLRAFSAALDRTDAPFEMAGWLQADKVPVSAFPPPFNRMRADDVEDMLCTYREVFDTW